MSSDSSFDQNEFAGKEVNAKIQAAWWRRLGEGMISPGIGFGIVAGIASAVLYTLANISLRNAISVDPFIVSMFKAAPTVLVLTPYLAAVKASGRPIATSRQWIPIFIPIALIGQVIGNGAFQVALGSIGLAASVPITLGSLLIGSAILGRLLLREPVRPRTLVSIGTLIIAVIVLSQSRGVDPVEWQSSSEVLPNQPVDWLHSPIVGAVGAMASGLAYAVFSTSMRFTMKRGMLASMAMWISGVSGTVALAGIVAVRTGWSPIADIPAPMWQSMIWAGIFNFTAFVAISTALKVLPVVAVHLINASQVAMASLAGVIVFEEPVTKLLVIGISLTLAGLTILATRRRPTPVSPPTFQSTFRSE
ncbi:DMT family transporter [Rhodopirellula sp. P2]|uniref:DMT family transporter n=1 Tax=Rhodopirellula sp. P2 TaxID=2127060 RepID=UPI0023678177|nr:DMT family transporter [Rhodopirellula sp. P2]WDQ15612.1 DMT family transporter [Rhodopirellula sp. P2]